MTLIEILVSVVFVGILASTVVSISPILLAMDKDALTNEVASAFAQRITEEVKFKWHNPSNFGSLSAIETTTFFDKSNPSYDPVVTRKLQPFKAGGSTFSSLAINVNLQRVTLSLLAQRTECATLKTCSPKVFVFDVGRP